MSTQITTDCQGDTKDSCDDISSWECYDNTVRHDCCQSCEDNVIYPVVPGCEFGDYVDQCDVKNGRRCYYNDVRRNCCNTCLSYETTDPGCRYGDKIDQCQQNECQTYSPQRRADCCMTCVNNVHVSTTQDASTGTWSTWHSITTSPTTDSPVTTVTSQGSGVPAWTVPVAAGVGGVLVLFIVVAVVAWCRRNRKPDHLSPISDRMYNDYKMSKRAPMAPPRHPSTEKGWVDEKEDGSEYAYINPDHVDGPQSKDRRNSNDPLPPTPGEYLDLSDAKSVSYGNYGYSPSEKLTHDGQNNVRVQSNKYDQLPAPQTYVNQTDTQPENGYISHKL